MVASWIRVRLQLSLLQGGWAREERGGEVDVGTMIAGIVAAEVVGGDTAEDVMTTVPGVMIIAPVVMMTVPGVIMMIVVVLVVAAAVLDTVGAVAGELQFMMLCFHVQLCLVLHFMNLSQKLMIMQS